MNPVTGSAEYLNQTADFIHFIIDPEENDEPYNLIDKPFRNDFSYCLKELAKEGFHFTKEEISHIENSIRKPLITFWALELAPGATIISSYAVDAIFNDDSKSWSYFKKHIGSGYHSFSAPIFLRDYTYCLFYGEYNCDQLIGSGESILFKKENDTWKVIMSCQEWIS